MPMHSTVQCSCKQQSADLESKEPSLTWKVAVQESGCGLVGVAFSPGFQTYTVIPQIFIVH